MAIHPLSFLTVFLMGVFSFMPLPSLAQTTTLAQNSPKKKHSTPTVFLNQKQVKGIPFLFKKNNTLYLPVELLPHLGVRIEVNKAKRQVRVISGKRIFLLKADTKFITWSQSNMRLSKVPIWRNKTLFVPSSFFAYLGLPLSHSRFTNEVKVNRKQNHFEALNVFKKQVYTRIVLELSQAPVYKLYESKEALTIDFYGTQVDEPEQFLKPIKDVLLDRVQIQQMGAGVTRLRIKKKYPSPHKVFWLKDPHRLMIDLLKIFNEESKYTIAPGVQYKKAYQGQHFGPVTYHVVKVKNPKKYLLKPDLALNTKGFTKARTSQISKKNKALLAINGSYFNHKGLPLGLFYKQGEFYSSPIYNRTFLGMTHKNTPFIDHTKRTLAASFPYQKDHRIQFHAVNLPRQNNQSVLYTPHYGQRTHTKPNKNALELQVLLDGTVQKINTHNSLIPRDGFVISAHGQGARWLKSHAYPGMRTLIYSQLYGQWLNIEHIISGGPRLLKKGQAYVTSKRERFQPDIAKGRAPRTAFGIGKQGELYFLVVDGRQKLSRGLTLWETAKLLKEQGAVEALNFDGGGSSTLVIKNQVVNRPSDGQERSVSNALLLIPR